MILLCSWAQWEFCWLYQWTSSIERNLRKFSCLQTCDQAFLFFGAGNKELRDAWSQVSCLLIIVMQHTAHQAIKRLSTIGAISDWPGSWLPLETTDRSYQSVGLVPSKAVTSSWQYLKTRTSVKFNSHWGSVISGQLRASIGQNMQIGKQAITPSQTSHHHTIICNHDYVILLSREITH